MTKEHMLHDVDKAEPGRLGFLRQASLAVTAGVVPGSALPVHLMYFGCPRNEVTIGVQ